jgi:hypothetical protein
MPKIIENRLIEEFQRTGSILPEKTSLNSIAILNLI